MDEKPARRGCISQRVGVKTHEASRIADVHALVPKGSLQPVGDVLGALPRRRFKGETPKGEQR
jgi:hypothetical protein